MSELVSMPNVNAADLAVRIIDSDERRLADTQEVVQSILPPDVEVTAARHPEVVRRQLELLSQEEDAQCSARKYNVFLTRERFDEFRKLFPRDTGASFDTDRSVKNRNGVSGVFQMLMTYFKLLAKPELDTFFTAVFPGNNTQIDPDIPNFYDENAHKLNLLNSEDFDPEGSRIVRLPTSSDRDSMEAQFRSLFEHFDKMVGMAGV